MLDEMATGGNGFEPELEHYGCVVDLLGRAGRVEVAFAFIKKMRLAPTAAIYGSLLGRREDVRIVRELMTEKAVIKEPGRSWIELDQILHTFDASDRSHPRREEVSAKVKELSVKLKEAAMISMGTGVSMLDLVNIKEICDQVLFLSEYRAQLYDSLKNRMKTIAPNLTALVGELVGARLIANGGSLLKAAWEHSSDSWS